MGGSNDEIHQKGRVIIELTEMLRASTPQAPRSIVQSRLANNEKKGIEKTMQAVAKSFVRHCWKLSQGG